MEVDVVSGSRSALRSLLSGDRIAIIGGAHDALSARLVEEAQYDGVWAGSFAMSIANRCLPDADLLTMNESLTIVRNMVQSVRSPVIADCSAGFGNVINTMQMIREYEAAGVAGVCIEDNHYPKRSSLYESWTRELVSCEEMAGKIRASKSVQTDPDFVVIARLESLIVREGIEAALRRAHAYVQAGADALLVHARAFAPLREFLTRWKGTVSLVAVPTLYPEIGLAELEQWGIKVAIYPNQSIRAAIRAMQQALGAIRQAGSALAVEETIVPLSEVDRIVEMESIRAAEAHFGGLPQPATA
jgi:phosphoenolpyruvate phosphomutase